jgi:hypothetical protein
MYRWLKRLCQPLSCYTQLMLASTMLSTALILLTVACARPQTTEHLWAIGQTAEVDGWRVTVHSFSTLPADEWRRPERGQLFCTVELTLENRSGQIRYVMPEKQMMLLDGDGRSYAPDRNAALITARSRQWLVPEGEFSVGQKAHGAAAYQIPSGSQGVRWVFRSSLFPWARKATFVLGDLAQP